jgi:hypothetical protein
MAKIRLIVEDDEGNQSEKSFALMGDLDSLDGIDEAVEQFKNRALPQIEQELLTRAQERAVHEEKKTLADQ